MKIGIRNTIMLVAMGLMLLIGCSDDSDAETDGDLNPDGDQFADGDEPADGDSDAVDGDGEATDGDSNETDGDSETTDGDADDTDGDADGNDADEDVTDVDPSADGDEPVVCSGHGLLENGICYCDKGWAVDPANAADCIEYQHEDGVPYLLKIYMHAPAATKIYFATMSVIGEMAASDYDIYVSHLSGPTLELNDHVQAVDLGNAKGFDEIDEAPETGYASDGEGVENMVIGIGYRSGGTGSSGYIMTGNIYVLKIDNGTRGVTYAKIEVKQAMNGEVHVLAYWQPDGSRNIATGENEDGDTDSDTEADGDSDEDVDGDHGTR